MTDKNNLDLPELKDKPEIKDNPIQNDVEINQLNQEEKKPIIEIPQEYYDKLEQEKLEKQRQEAEQEQKKHQDKIDKNNSANNFINIILNTIIIFALLYSMININNIIIIGIPIYIILYSIFLGIKKGEESNASTSILVGGMLSAIISLAISFSNKELEDLYLYYTVASVIVAFVGFIISNLITKIIYNHKNIKALQTIMIFAFFGLLIAIPFYIYNKYPEEFTKKVFLKQATVKAETEEEFIIKTLKNRYNIEFNCESNVKNFIDAQKMRVTTRTCKDKNNVKITVTSTIYDETNKQYTIKEDYLEQLYIKDTKNELIKDIKDITGANSVTVSLYPKENCNLIGDCVDCEDYYKNYEKENDRKNLYEHSKNLNLEKYLNLDRLDFINIYGFTYFISIYGNYNNSSNLDSLINNILDTLNDKGYKNIRGYEISVKNSEEINNEVYKVIGKTNDTLTFSNPEQVN